MEKKPKLKERLAGSGGVILESEAGARIGRGRRLRERESYQRSEGVNEKEIEDLLEGGGKKEKGSEDLLTRDFSLGSGMILIYFASPVLNCSPLFLVNAWIPLTFEDHLCNLFSVLGML